MRSGRVVVGCTVILGVLVGSSCTPDEPAPDPCGARVDLSCAPAYAPTFPNLFDNTLKKSCALAGTSCHSEAGHKAGLILETSDRAHQLLLENNRVVPGKPECSLVVHRIQSKDTSFMMPPGLALAPTEQCAIIQWIEGGAVK